MVAACRTAFLLTGWQMSLRYADSRQVWGYPILLGGALPDALWVRWIMPSRSSAWPLAMCISIALSSAFVAWVTVRPEATKPF